MEMSFFKEAPADFWVPTGFSECGILVSEKFNFIILLNKS